MIDIAQQFLLRRRRFLGRPVTPEQYGACAGVRGHALYQGRCVVVSRDIRDLGRRGNDRISSIKVRRRQGPGNRQALPGRSVGQLMDDLRKHIPRRDKW